MATHSMEAILRNQEVIRCSVCQQPMDKRRLHYGGYSCYSCRAFFRRRVQMSGSNKLCSHGGSCDVEEWKRKNCIPCRYTNCLLEGMRAELVLTEENKKKRFRKKLARDEEELKKNPDFSTPPKRLSLAARRHLAKERSRVTYVTKYYPSKKEDLIGLDACCDNVSPPIPSDHSSPDQDTPGCSIISGFTNMALRHSFDRPNVDPNLTSLLFSGLPEPNLAGSGTLSTVTLSNGIHSTTSTIDISGGLPIPYVSYRSAYGQPIPVYPVIQSSPDSPCYSASLTESLEVKPDLDADLLNVSLPASEVHPDLFYITPPRSTVIKREDQPLDLRTEEMLMSTKGLGRGQWAPPTFYMEEIKLELEESDMSSLQHQTSSLQQQTGRPSVIQFFKNSS